jgi:hypothetical protein
LLPIKEDAELLPQMFANLVEENNRIKKQEEMALSGAKEAVQMKADLEKRIADLLNECERKKKLSIQAVAARSEVKRHLDEAVAKV